MRVNGQQTCNYTLSGNISDADTREPILMATIEIKGLKTHVHTDTNGYYVIRDLCEGEYLLTITHFTCEPLVVKVKVNGNLLRNFVLPHKTNELREIVIKDKFVANTVSIKEELNNKLLFARRGLTLAEILNDLPGVSAIQTGNNIQKPVIQGLHSNRVPIITNGAKLESQQWGSDHAPEIDPLTAYKTTVIKGAGALRYSSDAIGGAIIIEHKPLPVDGKIAGELFSSYFSNGGMFSNSLMLEQNSKVLPAFSWRASGSWRKGGNQRTPDYYLWNSGTNEWNGNIQLGYRKPNYSVEWNSKVFNTQLGIFLGSQIGNLTDLNAAIQRRTPLFNKNEFSYQIDRPRQEIRHQTHQLKYTYYKDPAHLFYSLTTLQINRRKEYDLARITEAPELDLTLTTLQSDNWYEHKHERWMYTYGISAMYQQNIWNGSRFFIPNFNLFNAAGYFISRYQFKQKSELELGIRYDYRTLESFRNSNGNTSSSKRNWNNFSGTANFSRTINKHVSYLINSGLAWRAPSINELYVNGLHHGTSSFEIGDAQLKNEVAYKLGVQFNLVNIDSIFDFEVYVYNNYISGFINLVPDTPATLTIRGAFPTFRYVQTTANLSGFDVKATVKFSRAIKFHTAYSIVYAYDITNQTWLSQMPGNRIRSTISYQPNKRLKKFEPILNISLLSVINQQRLSNVFIDYLNPPPTYHLLQAGLQFKIKNIDIHLGITNALNDRYREYLNRFRYFNDEAGRNITIRLLYHF